MTEHIKTTSAKTDQTRRMTFNINAALVDRLKELRDAEGLKDNTAAMNYVLRDYFERADGRALQVSLDTAKSVKYEIDKLLKIMLVIGAANTKTKLSLSKFFPEYFTIERDSNDGENS